MSRERQPEVKLQICKIDRPRKIIGQIDLNQLAPRGTVFSTDKLYSVPYGVDRGAPR